MTVTVEKLLADPRYQMVVSYRRLLTFSLASVLMIVAIGFALLSVCWSSLVAATVSDEIALPLGFIVTELILLLSLVIVCGYAWHMNSKLTPLIDKIVSEIAQ